MHYGEVFSKAWKTIWKHKILWLFGILAGCNATGITTRSSGAGGRSGTGWRMPMNNSYPFQRFMYEVGDLASDIQPWVWIMLALGVIGLIFLLWVLFQFLGTLGTTGVIKGTILADDRSDDEKALSLSQIFKSVQPVHWNVFLLNLGVKLGGSVLLLLLIAPIILYTVCTCFTGLLFLIPLGWFLELWLIFTILAITIEEKGVFPAIGRAWDVIFRNLGHVLLMWLILGLGSLIVGILLAVPLLVVPVPVIVNLLSTGMMEFSLGFIISMVLLVLLLPILILLSGVLKAYVLSAWTLIYQRLTQNDPLHPEVIVADDL